MFEVVDCATRESEGRFFGSYVEAVEYGESGEPGTLFEVWTVADDEHRTRMVLHGRHRVREAAVMREP